MGNTTHQDEKTNMNLDQKMIQRTLKGMINYIKYKSSAQIQKQNNISHVCFLKNVKSQSRVLNKPLVDFYNSDVIPYLH